MIFKICPHTNKIAYRQFISLLLILAVIYCHLLFQTNVKGWSDVFEFFKRLEYQTYLYGVYGTQWVD